MSYAIDLAPDAAALIKSFDSSMEELILDEIDEIDEIANNPAAVEFARPYPFVGFDKKYVFRIANRMIALFVRLNEQKRTLYVQNISVQGD